MFSAITENSVVSKLKGLIPTDKSKQELVSDLIKLRAPQEIVPTKTYAKKVVDSIAQRQQHETKKEIEDLKQMTTVSRRNQKLDE